MREPEAEPYFSRPLRQIMSMLIALGLIGAGAYVGFPTLDAIFWSNPYLNGLILAVFFLGILSCFGQVIQLMYSVQWIEAFSRTQSGEKPPSLLAPLATLMRSRGARMHLSQSSSRSILDSVGSRIDEDREITRYLGSTLIFLGLLGTFYGLATTVPALVDTIRSLSPNDGETGAEVFGRLQAGLEAQLGGMGTAFSSSLLGLAGSLIVGLLELFAGHGQNRFYRELEEWLSTITRIGFASGDELSAASEGDASGAVAHIAEHLEAMQMMFTQSDINRSQVDDRMNDLIGAVNRLAGQLEEGGAKDAMLKIAEGQKELIDQLASSGVDGLDAESRMRLRSIDVQLLRILEELSVGRQETLGELRSDIAGLTRALRQGRGRPDSAGRG
ncbi:MAG TPA: biopolymer transporter ExbB [Paracoccaceae bacterium]|nr:biopolymer transporter ExbB [Paracoccaceae bacterium]